MQARVGTKSDISDLIMSSRSLCLVPYSDQPYSLTGTTFVKLGRSRAAVVGLSVQDNLQYFVCLPASICEVFLENTVIDGISTLFPIS